MKKKKDYIDGVFETQKFADLKKPYYKGLEIIKNLNYDVVDFIHHFPCFTGHLTLARFLALYECYQKTLGISGHIAEVGIYKGAILLFFTKLTQIFESQSLTQVHGFDWFKGNEPDEFESKIVWHGDAESYERVMKLIEAQGLSNIVFVHKLDVTKELGAFFEQHSHLQFKLVFLDAGMYRVVKAALPIFWDRLTKGGYLVLDQFNHEVAPGETKAVTELLPDRVIHTFPYAWMPTAYIIK